MNEKQMVNKFTLSSGKIVYLREGKIEDLENATAIAGKGANTENLIHIGQMTQKELTKALLVGIQESEDSEFRKLKIAEKENLNALLTLGEYTQTLKAVQMVTGDAGQGNVLQPEFVSLPSESANTGDK